METLKEDLVKVGRKIGITHWVKLGIAVVIGVLAVAVLCACTGPRVEGGRGESVQTVPYEAGVAPTGKEHKVMAQEDWASFMVDDAYTDGFEENKVFIYTNKEGEAPKFLLSIVVNKNDDEMRKILENLQVSIEKTYNNKTPSVPEISFMELGGRKVGRIDYEFELDNRGAAQKFAELGQGAKEENKVRRKGLILTTEIDGYYFSVHGVFLPDDTYTPAAMEHAMDTLESYLGDSES